MKLTGISGTVDMDKILPHVKTSQDIHLQTIIGTALLEKCKSLVEAGTLNSAGNENYKVLVEQKIAPVLVNYCMVDFLPFMAFEISNGGVYKHTPENTTPLEIGEVYKLVQAYKDKAEFYTTRLKDYLCTNSNLFPEYVQASNGQMPSTGGDVFHGWVM